MKTQNLLYDENLPESYLKRLDEILPVHEVHKVKFQSGGKQAWGEETVVLLCLNDEQIAEVLPRIQEKKWIAGFLPHPQGPKTRKEFGVDSDPEKAFKHIQETTRTVKTDALYCNDRLVLSSIIIGDALSMPQESFERNIWLRIINVFRRIGKLTVIKHHKYKITGKDPDFKEINTSALGIVVVERMNALLLTKKLEGNTFINDGFLNALILSPTSVFEMLGFVFRSLIPGLEHLNKLPKFIGSVKTRQLTIETEEVISFLIDGVELNTKLIEMEVQPAAIEIIPGRHLKLPENKKTGKKSYQIHALPKSRAADYLATRSLPLIKRAATEDFKDLFVVLRQNAQTTNTYLIMMTLSTLLATFGLYANSTPVVIGAMILAPLISPIVSISMALVRQDTELLFKSSKTLLFGTVLALLATAFFALIIPIKIPTPEIEARTAPTLLDLGVAFISGIAAAYTHAREELAKSLAGIAIAVALVPPLAVAGVGIGWFDFSIFFGGFILYLTNLTGIFISAGLTFILLGFAPFKIARKGLIITLIMLVPISVPLSFGFSKMYREAMITRSLERVEIENHKIRDLNIRVGSPTVVSLRLVSDRNITEGEIDGIKQVFEERLGKEIELEVVTAIRR